MRDAILKSQIRSSIREQRSLLSSEQIDEGKEILKENFMSRELDSELRSIISSAKCVALYKAVNGELSCDGVTEYLMSLNKTVCFPRVKGDSMDFYEIKDMNLDFSTGAYSIPEPRKEMRKIQPEDIDLMIVPAVAFTDDGIRLGQGGGYYDRFLNALAAKNKAPYTIGVCYDFQMYSALPVEKHDYAVDCVLCVCVTDTIEDDTEEDFTEKEE